MRLKRVGHAHELVACRVDFELRALQQRVEHGQRPLQVFKKCELGRVVIALSRLARVLRPFRQFLGMGRAFGAPEIHEQPPQRPSGGETFDGGIHRYAFFRPQLDQRQRLGGNDGWLGRQLAVRLEIILLQIGEEMPGE